MLTCVLFGLMAGFSFRGIIMSFSEGAASWGDLAIPLWIPRVFIFVGCLFMFLYDVIYLFWPKDDIGANR